MDGKVGGAKVDVGLTADVLGGKNSSEKKFEERGRAAMRSMIFDMVGGVGWEVVVVSHDPAWDGVWTICIQLLLISSD